MAGWSMALDSGHLRWVTLLVVLGKAVLTISQLGLP